MYFNLSKVKSLFICLLIGLAIYQTNELWFGDSLNHNFFNSFLNRTPNVENKEVIKKFVTPYRIVTNYFNNKADISYSDIANLDIFNVGYKAISECLNKGEYLKTGQIDYKDIMDSRGLMFEYSFQMPAETFAYIIGQKSNNLTSKVDNFNLVFIIPDTEMSERAYIYFVDSSSNKYVEYSIKNITLCDKIRDSIRISQRDLVTGDLYYIPIVLNETLFFFPSKDSEAYEYKNLEIGMDYYEEEFLTKEIEKNINLFFEIPSLKWNVNEEVLTYSDTNIVVKYYDKDILEYTNYKMNSSYRGSTLLQDYTQAVEFITKDVLNDGNEYYLHSYVEEDRYRHFYFDFVCNDFPIIINYKTLFFNTDGDELTKESESSISDMKHGIEITIEDGTLIKYRKICYKFNPSLDNTHKLMLDINEMNLDFDLSEVDDIILGYNIYKRYDWRSNTSAYNDEDNDSNKIELSYVILQNNEYFARSVK